jgi:hypothetical protein
MKFIPVGEHIALVDDCDYEKLSQYKWYPERCNHTIYAVTFQYCGNTTVRMHELIISKPFKWFVILHKNDNGLDNQRNNLKASSQRDNILTKKLTKVSDSGILGVYWYAKRNKWKAIVKVFNTTEHVGYFDDKVEAAKARNEHIVKRGLNNRLSIY